MPTDIEVSGTSLSAAEEKSTHLPAAGAWVQVARDGDWGTIVLEENNDTNPHTPNFPKKDTV